MKSLLLILVFAMGDCVHVTQQVWWSYKNWVIVGIEESGFTIYDGEWTVHDVPEKMLRKCE